MKTITVDARMLESSGIGTVLRNILKRIIPAMPNLLFYLLGNPATLSKYSWLIAKNVQYIPCRSAIYTIHEQWELAHKIPIETNLLGPSLQYSCFLSRPPIGDCSRCFSPSHA